ncbi:MAG TPA: hypothetical protein VFC44_00690, partial [Candidatus Saccharimonadales bacterium]|nr:hypothetical protein [Candidatus Saccharimonadales bacterium]
YAGSGSSTTIISPAISPARKSAARKSGSAAKSLVGALPFLPWFYNGGGIQMYAFDVTDPANPAPVSTTTVGTNGWPNGNAVFATNGLVYVDHSVWSYFIHGRPVKPAPGGLAAPNVTLPLDYLFGETSDLDVVDFTVPSSPIVRNPVSIPGALAGLSRGGDVVYTVDFDGSLAALAYDGVSTYLVATLPPPANGFQETLIAGETIFTAQSTSTNDTTSKLDAWTLNDAGVFSKEDVLHLSEPVYALANFGNLLGIQAGPGLTLVDFTHPAKLVTVGIATPNQCVWLSLTGASGAPGAGLWVPLGAYGVFPILAP